MPRLEAASISITSTALPAVISRQLAQTPQGCRGGPLDAVQAAGQNARDGGFAGAALAGEDIAVRDPLLRDRVLEGGPDVLLADQLREGLRPVLSGDDLVHEIASDRMACANGRICQTPGDPRHTS